MGLIMEDACACERAPKSGGEALEQRMPPMHPVLPLHCLPSSPCVYMRG